MLGVLGLPVMAGDGRGLQRPDDELPPVSGQDTSREELQPWHTVRASSTGMEICRPVSLRFGGW